MPTLKERVQKYFIDLLPTKRLTRFDVRSSTPAIIRSMSVDRALEVFTAAENGNPADLFALYRDILLAHSHLQAQFATRKCAVLGDALNLQPFDKNRPEDVAAKDALWPMVNHPDWFDACNHLLDASLWPVAVVEKVYRLSRTPGLRYELDRLVPLPYELLDFQTGRLRIRDTDEAGNPLSSTHDPDPRRYIVHRGHLLTTPDHWGGPMRSLVFWMLLGTMDREWWGRFLDRYGSPFPVGKYDDNDDESRSVLMQAFAVATKLGGLVVSKETEVELIQAAAADAGTAFEKFHDCANREISKLILGQTLSADAASTGLGSGVATAQDAVRDDIRQFDAKRLGFTITTQLAAQFIEINGLKGKPPLFAWGSISSAEKKAIGDFLTALKTGGLRVADDGLETLSEQAGLPLERDQGGGGGGLFPFSVRSHAADPSLIQAQDAIARAAAANLSQTLGRHHAELARLIRTAASPQDALGQIETYAARFEPGEAARIVEEALLAYAANGSVVALR
jgi:phage gp29-like protein